MSDISYHIVLTLLTYHVGGVINPVFALHCSSRESQHLQPPGGIAFATESFQERRLDHPGTELRSRSRRSVPRVEQNARGMLFPEGLVQERIGRSVKENSNRDPRGARRWMTPERARWMTLDDTAKAATSGCVRERKWKKPCLDAKSLPLPKLL